ncbi:uncharacterized protein LOC124928123 isoform X2 [Impatiens glandulifera]|nr:uncharacterized protein LOC124928123 isoform X2 [Impatiens glandulifera]
MVGLPITSPEPIYNPTLKFLCSYGGKIFPRFPDAKLRYHGGVTRLIAVDRSVTFSELLIKMGELCGTSVRLKCQLPKEDLDALVSITSDEDLANIIEEYDRINLPKIRAFIWPINSTKGISNSPSVAISSASTIISPVASYSLSRCTPTPRLMIAAAAANR